jgi:hypothetical protein
MTIANPSVALRYALSRGEVASAYFYGWKYSPVFRAHLLCLAAITGIASVVIRYLGPRPLTRTDFASGAGLAAGLLLFLPVWFALRAKTGERTLELTTEGIATRIGARSATFPWSTIAAVSDARAFVIISRANRNAFFIPGRAFADDGARRDFIERALSSMQSAT